ncbi:MAG TPA: glucose-1-phosphate cytidylyltransferase [Ramlibacter sp.]|uniref:glucose-1-phosphate cytidylyltransferase n=1 Tax=Ramlibacter sp. TaxID=1917967 RepID=UPI002ED305FE
MQVVLLAGGLGTRLAEETDRIPKPMVTIGSQPILWHIMKLYASFGFKDFVICGGYKVSSIIEYFVNYRQHTSNLCIDIARNEVRYLNESSEDWKVTIIDTGDTTMTGGRLKRVREYLKPDQPFCMTYGDGLADVDIGRLVAYHREKRCEATLTAVRPPARFGATIIEDGRVTKFSEKPVGGDGHINGGFFVLNPPVLDLITGDQTVWEQEPLETLAANGKLGAFIHDGFWQPMDTLRDRRQLEQLWESGRAPWKRW